MGLTEYKDTYPADLSTGYKRAVAIARALAAQPECILYDEPTTMVDPIMADHLGNLMLRLKTQLQLTGVVVTHDLDLMRRVADKVVVLFEGRAIYFGPRGGSKQVLASPYPGVPGNGRSGKRRSGVEDALVQNAPLREGERKPREYRAQKDGRGGGADRKEAGPTPRGRALHWPGPFANLRDEGIQLVLSPPPFKPPP